MVYEPNFLGNPFQDEIIGVNWTLNIMARQNFFMQRLLADPEPIFFQDKIILTKDALRAASIYMERGAPKPEAGDSGWYIGVRGVENKNPKLEAIYAYQLLAVRPELVDVLTAPRGYMVFFDGSTLSAVLNAESVPVI